jgi:hypothetical protein
VRLTKGETKESVMNQLLSKGIDAKEHSEVWNKKGNYTDIANDFGDDKG